MRPSEILRTHREMVLQIIAAHHANNPRVILEIAVLRRGRRLHPDRTVSPLYCRAPNWPAYEPVPDGDGYTADRR